MIKTKKINKKTSKKSNKKVIKKVIKKSKRKRKRKTNNSINNVITFSDFENYMHKGNLLLDERSKKRKLIEINDALNIYKHRHMDYKGPETNKQFITIGNNNNITAKYRFTEMLHYFIDPLNADIVQLMIKYNLLDSEIFKFIKKNYTKGTFDTNSIFRMSRISDYIFKHLKNIDKPKILDVGVGSGKKIKYIRDFIHSCEIYGADIESWGPYEKKRKFDFPFKPITFNPYKIHYNDNMFDCITLILTLHHSNVVETINECKRILKKDGIIVIVEHDVWYDYENIIIDLQHKIYEIIFDEKPTDRGTYYNFIEWDILFDRCDMKPIFSTMLFSNASHEIRYDLQFIGIYKNNI